MAIPKNTCVKVIFPGKHPQQLNIKRFVTTIPGGNVAQVPIRSGIDKVTGLWLLGCGGMCFGAVVLGAIFKSINVRQFVVNVTLIHRFKKMGFLFVM